MTVGLPGRIVLRLEDEGSRDAIADQIQAAAADRIIRVVDLVVVQKDRDGDATLTQVVDGVDDPFASLARLIAAPVAQRPADDVTGAVGEVANGSAALVLVFEHRWAEPLAAVGLDVAAVPAARG